MCKTFVLLVLIFGASTANAQISAGEILYEVRFQNTLQPYVLSFAGTKGKYQTGSQTDSVEKEYYFSASDSCYLGKSVAAGYEVEAFRLGSGVDEKTPKHDTMTIAGFPCRKVNVRSSRGREYTLWYTNVFPVNASPVPGLWTEGTVLAIESEGLNVRAKEWRAKAIDEKSLALPKNWRLVKAADPTQTKMIRQ